MLLQIQINNLASKKRKLMAFLFRDVSGLRPIAVSLDILRLNKMPIGVNAGGEPTVKASFIPLVCLTDRKIA